MRKISVTRNARKGVKNHYAKQKRRSDKYKKDKDKKRADLPMISAPLGFDRIYRL